MPTAPLLTLLLVAAALPASAGAVSQTREDPSDAPSASLGKADVRSVSWDVGAASATVTVALEASAYQDCSPGCTDVRAQIGVHVLLDVDGDDIADDEIAAQRNADGTQVDAQLRSLDRTLSTGDCQDLAGKPGSAVATVATTVADGLESFSFSFDPALVPGRLEAFRWAVLAQAPADPAAPAPWDVVPDAANPEPAAANPGDRRCDAGKTGLAVRMSAGIAFPEPPAPAPPDSGGEPPPPPPPTPAAADTLAPAGVLGGSRSQRLGETIVVSVACPDEPCRATAGGTVRVSGNGTARARTYRLRKVTRAIAGGATAKLNPKLSKAARRAIGRALRHGKRAVATIEVSIVDASGNRRTLKRLVRLRR
jgi:hypothetical protein